MNKSKNSIHDSPERQESVLNLLVDEEVRAQTVLVMKALSSPSRIHILAALVKSESGGACVGEIVTLLGLSQSTVSHHLRVLLEANVVIMSRRGKLSWYEVKLECSPLMRGVLG